MTPAPLAHLMSAVFGVTCHRLKKHKSFTSEILLLFLFFHFAAFKDFHSLNCERLFLILLEDNSVINSERAEHLIATAAVAAVLLQYMQLLQLQLSATSLVSSSAVR